MVALWDWHTEGFLHPPVRRPSIPNEHVFRVWGGTSELLGRPGRPGVCFSLRAPLTRREAERAFAIFEWGNAARYVTQFLLPQGIEIWIGMVHPGYIRTKWTWPPDQQVFIENPTAQTLRSRALRTTKLIDDLQPSALVSYPDPGKHKPRGFQ